MFSSRRLSPVRPIKRDVPQTRAGRHIRESTLAENKCWTFFTLSLPFIASSREGEKRKMRKKKWPQPWKRCVLVPFSIRHVWMGVHVCVLSFVVLQFHRDHSEPHTTNNVPHGLSFLFHVHLPIHLASQIGGHSIDGFLLLRASQWSSQYVYRICTTHYMSTMYLEKEHPEPPGVDQETITRK